MPGDSLIAIKIELFTGPGAFAVIFVIVRFDGSPYARCCVLGYMAAAIRGRILETIPGAAQGSEGKEG